MMLAAIWTALICAMPAVRASRTLTALKIRQQLLNATRRSFLSLRQPSGMSSEFFTHDSEKMYEMNGPDGPGGLAHDTGTRYSGRFATGGGSKKPDCHPKCVWQCGGGCDEVCTPVCAPPKCETSCGPLENAACYQHCPPPKCAVVCPPNCNSESPGAGYDQPNDANKECPDCKTICAPPECHTVCSNNCESRCAEPQCTWNCKPSPQCVQPKCKLDCGHPKVCSLDKTNDYHDIHAEAFSENWLPGHEVMATGLANLDPTAIEAPAGTPPPGTVVPYHIKGADAFGRSAPKAPTEPFGPGPVKGAWLPGQEPERAPPGAWTSAIWFPGAMPPKGAWAPGGAGQMDGAAQPKNISEFKPCCEIGSADYSVQDPQSNGPKINPGAGGKPPEMRGLPATESQVANVAAGPNVLNTNGTLLPNGTLPDNVQAGNVTSTPPSPPPPSPPPITTPPPFLSSVTR